MNYVFFEKLPVIGLTDDNKSRKNTRLCYSAKQVAGIIRFFKCRIPVELFLRKAANAETKNP